MKKLIISTICLLALVAGVSSYAYYHSHQIVAKNSLALDNVEALADFETAFRKAFNDLYNSIYQTVKDQCPDGTIPCADFSTTLSIPEFWDMTVTLHFYKAN